MGARNVSVIEDPDRQRFTVQDAGVDAELNYELRNGRLVITRTFTAPEHRGQGIAGQLVSAAVERARHNNETVVPACWYARRWLDENPDAADGLTVE